MLHRGTVAARKGIAAIMSDNDGPEIRDGIVEFASTIAELQADAVEEEGE